MGGDGRSETSLLNNEQTEHVWRTWRKITRLHGESETEREFTDDDTTRLPPKKLWIHDFYLTLTWEVCRDQAFWSHCLRPFFERQQALLT